MRWCGWRCTLPSAKTRLKVAVEKLASDKALLDRFNSLTSEEALALVRKGRSKPDAAVERLVRKHKPRKPFLVATFSVPELRLIITAARQSAARECAEIAREVELEYDLRTSRLPMATRIRICERFGLEGE